MSIPEGTHSLGPESATLKVLTARIGAAAKAGHDLVIEVGAWGATLSGGAEANISLTADSRSFRVLEGTGGVKSLTNDDKAAIRQTIDEDVLKGCAIEFRSTSIDADGDRLAVRGELELAGQRRPITFELALGADGALTGTATVKQTQWGIKPYSALFGTLKVADEVTVVLDAKLPAE